MKNLTLLFALLFSLILSTSCEKEEMVTPEQTLEQKYSDWSNLTWKSTDGNSESTKYPRLDIKIVGNNITVTQTMSLSITYTETYTEMSVTNSSVNFGNSDITGTYTSNGQEITLTTDGLSTEIHIYTLTIN